MSDEVIAADDGAPVAPVENTATEQDTTQGQAQDTTTEQVDKPTDDKPRDDKGRFVPQERVNEITRARREAERREQAQQQRADALERELASLRQTAQHQPQSNEKAPSLADFNYDMDAWSAAMQEHLLTQAEHRVEQRIAGKTQQQRQREIQESFETKAAKYAVDHPDFGQAVEELGRTIRFSPEVVEAIGVNDHGPAVDQDQL